jgi:hypothetical protein
MLTPLPLPNLAKPISKFVKDFRCTCLKNKFLENTERQVVEACKAPLGRSEKNMFGLPDLR